MYLVQKQRQPNMDQFPGHKCQLTLGSRTYLPKLLPTASWWQKLSRKFHKSIIVSMKNPITSQYFKSQGSIAREHRRQSKLPYTVIHPCCHFLAFWRITVVFTYAIYLLLIPYYIAFFDKLPDPGIFSIVLQISIGIVLYLEIVVKFYTGYYDKANEVFVLNRNEIRKEYMMTTFFPDIISSFPGLLFLRMYSDYQNMDIRSLIILYIIFGCFLLSFLNIPKICRYYQIISTYFEFEARSDLVIKVGLCSLYTIHLASLLNEIISALGAFVEENAFGQAYALIDVGLYKQSDYPIKSNTSSFELNPKYLYTRALLYTLEGFIGSGFVNLNELHNIYKKYINTFSMLGGWICKAFFIIILIQTIMSHDRSAMLYDGFIDEVTEYCNRFKLPNDLAANIFKYIEYKFRNNYFNEGDIFRTLTSRLESQITMDQCKRFMSEVNLFKNLPRSTIKNIMCCLKLEIYLPGEYIIRADETGSKMFFLETGSAKVVSLAGLEISNFEDGSYFGEISLLNENKLRSASVIAVELCETYSLSKADFFNVIEPNAELLAQMKKMASERVKETSGKHL